MKYSISIIRAPPTKDEQQLQLPLNPAHLRYKVYVEKKQVCGPNNIECAQVSTKCIKDIFLVGTSWERQADSLAVPLYSHARLSTEHCTQLNS